MKNVQFYFDVFPKNIPDLVLVIAAVIYEIISHRKTFTNITFNYICLFLCLPVATILIPGQRLAISRNFWFTAGSLSFFDRQNA